jgi:hypothetical protein
LRENALPVPDFLVGVLVSSFRDFEKRSSRVKLRFGDHALLDQFRSSIPIESCFVEHSARLPHRCSLFGIDTIVDAIGR